MGRSPCSDDASLKKGPWTVEEDEKLREFIRENGYGSWRALPKLAGLNRCGKSCRLRWTNYLRPDIKRGKFSEEEEHRIIELHSVRGNKWSEIARQLPGRTDNEIKNYWNTHLRKRLLQKGIDPTTHRPRADLAFLASIPSLIAAANLGSDPIDSALRLHDATQLAKLQLLNNLVQVLTSTPAAPLLAPSLQSTDLGRLFHGQTLPPIGHQLPSHTSVVSPDVIHIPAGSTDSRDGYGSPELLGGFTPHASDAGGDPIVYNHAYDTYSNQLGFSTPDQSRQDLSFVMNSDTTSYDMWGESSYDDFNLMEQYLP